MPSSAQLMLAANYLGLIFKLAVAEADRLVQLEFRIYCNWGGREFTKCRIRLCSASCGLAELRNSYPQAGS